MAESENFWLVQRTKLDKSQFEMAIAVGKTPSAIAAWENDNATPRLKDAAKLAAAYQISEERVVKAIVEQSRRIALATAK